MLRCVLLNVRLRLMMYRLASMKISTLRVYGMLECKVRNSYCADDPDVEQIIREDGMFTLRAVKIFAGTSSSPSHITVYSLTCGRRRTRLMGCRAHLALHRQTLAHWLNAHQPNRPVDGCTAMVRCRVAGQHPRHR